MTSVLLLIILIVLLTFNYWWFRRVFHPAIIFIFFFALSVLNGIINIATWDFYLNWVTVGVIAGGALIFTVCSVGTDAVIQLVRTHEFLPPFKLQMQQNEKKKKPAKPVIIPLWVYLVSIAFLLITAVLMLKKVESIVYATGYQGDPLHALTEYTRVTKFEQTDTSVRGVLGQMFVISQAMNYAWGYVALRNLFSSARKIDWLAWINFVLASLIPLTSGARAGIVSVVFAILIYVLIFFSQENVEFRTKYTKKIAFAVVGIAVIGVLAFRPLVMLMGRDTGSINTFQYISFYLGAPVKNLDMYLSGSLAVPIVVTSQYWGQQTFAIFYESIAHWTGQTIVKNWTDWQPNQSYHGHRLGNVYTTYYPYIFDWGIIGAFVAIAVTAVLCQWLYSHVLNYSLLCYNTLQLSTITYGLVSYGLMMSFYLNFLVTNIVSSSFIRMFIVWVAISVGLYVLESVKERRKQQNKEMTTALH